MGEHDLYALLADVAVLQRDEPSLQKYAPLAEEFASKSMHRVYQAVAHRAWGVLHQLAGQHKESESRLNNALETFQQMKMRWQEGRTLQELGELFRGWGDKPSARDYFARALAAFDEIGAAPDTARMRERIFELS